MFAPRDPNDYLLDTERRVIGVRRRWATLLWDAFEAVALIVICVLLSYLLPPSVAVGQNILRYAALLIVLRFAYQLMGWWGERLVVTDKRFILTHGVFTTEV